MSGPSKWSLGDEPPEPATWPEPETQAEGDEKADDAPVYDDRGNVRPRGTEGAQPMSYAERVETAKALGNTDEATQDGDEGDKPARRTRKGSRS